MSGVNTVNQLADTLESFSGCSILVIGDLMLDEYLWGHIERISPEAPVPVLNIIRRESKLGGAGNVVQNLHSLGVQVAAVGVVGDDPTGQQIVELFDVLGVESEGILCDLHRKSTLKARLMSLEHGQQVFRIDEESVRGVWGEVESRLIELIRAKAEDIHAILCSDHQKGMLTPRVLQAVFDSARRQHIPVIVSPKGSNAEQYSGASILMLNKRELAQLTGTRVDGNDWLNDSARRLMEMLELEALVVTRGLDGMCLFEPSSVGIRRVDVPTVARSVYDAAGAGDTAKSTFCAALAAGASRESAVQLANHAAGVVMGKRGTATVTVEEIRAQLPPGSGGPTTPKGHPSRMKSRSVS